MSNVGTPPSRVPKCNGAGQGQNTDHCAIPVRVDPDGSGSCKVTLADPGQDTVVFKLGRKDKWIRWSMEPSDGGTTLEGFVFDKDAGVDFDADPLGKKSDPLGNFKTAHTTGTVCSRMNRNDIASGAGPHPYTIKVRNAMGSITCERDPTIRNE